MYMCYQETYNYLLRNCKKNFIIEKTPQFAILKPISECLILEKKPRNLILVFYFLYQKANGN